MSHISEDLPARWRTTRRVCDRVKRWVRAVDPCYQESHDEGQTGCHKKGGAKRMQRIMLCIAVLLCIQLVLEYMSNQ